VGTVPAGSETNIAVALVAPTEPGRYVSYWRLVVPPHMRKFGQRYWVQVVIVRGDGSVDVDVSEQQVVHNNVECDVSGVYPIVGARYHKKGCNYDICESVFQTLPPSEQALYERIDRPGATPVDMATNSGPGCETVVDELDARFGWTPSLALGVANSEFADMVARMQEELSSEQFNALSAALDPLLRVDEHLLKGCLKAIEPSLVAVLADPSMLENVPDHVAAIMADPKAASKAAKQEAKMEAKAAKLEAKMEAKAAKHEANMQAKAAKKAAKMEEKKVAKMNNSQAQAARMAWQDRPYSEADEAPPTYSESATSTESYTATSEDAAYTSSEGYVPPPQEVIDHDKFPQDDSEAVTSSPRTMQEALAEMGIAKADLSASMLAEIEDAMQHSGAEEHAQDQALLAEVEQEVAAVAAEVDAAVAAAEAQAAKEAEVTQAEAEAAAFEAQIEATKAAYEAEALAAEAAVEAERKAAAEVEAVAEAERKAAAELQTEELEAEAMAMAMAEAESKRMTELLEAEAKAAVQAEAEAAAFEAEVAAAKAAAEAANEAAAEAAAEEAEATFVAEIEAAKVAYEAAAEAEAAAAASKFSSEVSDEELYPVLPAAPVEAPQSLDVSTRPLVEHLLSMGFEYDASVSAIIATDGNLEAAVMLLLAAPVGEPAPAVEPQAEQPAEAEAVGEPAWNEEWDDILSELKEMGFEDETANRALIVEKKGDVKDAVKELVTRERAGR